jgi:hypothetical protein
MNKNAPSTPPDWRSYLYDKILIPVECEAVKFSNDKFKTAPTKEKHGIEIRYAKTLEDTEKIKCPYSSGEFLVYHCGKHNTKPFNEHYKYLLKTLRNVVAHADYQQGPKGWLQISHRYHDKLKIHGKMKLSTLKKLISYINAE